MGNFLFHRRRKRDYITKGRDQFGYRDVTQEHEHTDLEVLGQLPNFLQGKLYRQAGGAFLPVPEEDGLGGIDGLGHVACFEFHDNKVKFTNKFYDSGYYRHWKDTGDRAWDTTGVKPTGFHDLPPGKAPFAKNNNVTFWRWSKSEGDTDLLIASASEQTFGESCLLDSDCKTIGSIKDCSKEKFGFFRFFSAHYAENEHGSDLHTAFYFKILKMFPIPTFSFGYLVSRSGKNHSSNWEILTEHELCQFKYNEKDRVEPAKCPPYSHSSGETEHYVIQTVNSFRLNAGRFARQDWSNGFFGMFDFHNDLPMEFNVYNSKTGEVVKMGIKAKGAAMCFHVVNCFEQDDTHIILDTSWSDGIDAPFTSDTSVAPKKYGIMRYVLDLETGTATEEMLCSGVDKPGEVDEFACINPKHLRKSYNYFWGLTENPNTAHESNRREFGNFLEEAYVVRFDNKTKVSKHIELTQGGDINNFYFTEPQFVPRPGSTNELDGVIVATGNDREAEKSYVFIFDADTMKEVARCECPITVNHGLHNLWVPTEDTYPLKI